MSLPRLVEVCLKRQRATFLAVLLAAFAAAVAITLLLPKQYEATATLVVGEHRPLTREDTIAQDELLARTYGELLEKPATVERVARALTVQVSPSDLRAALAVEVLNGTQLIDITVTDEDPARAQALAEGYAREFVRSERRAVRESGSAALGELSRRARELAVEIDRLENDPAPESAGRLEEARNELEAVRASYRSTEESLTLRSTSVSIASVPGLPDAPSRPRPKLYIALGLLTALALAIGAALLRDAFDRRVRSEEELVELLGVPVVARVPEEGPGVEGVIAHEAFHLLRSNLELDDPERRRSMVAVTSALPNDGKSFVSARLALALGSSGLDVVAVDCDLRQPALHSFFGLSNAKGLSNVLVGARSADELLEDTQHPNVRVLPGGPQPPTPAVLLASARCRAVLQDLAARSDYLVLDTPPVAVGADATAVAAAADGVLLVVDLARARRDALSATRAQLERSGTRLLGVVLNREQPLVAEFRRYYAGNGSPGGRSERRVGA